MLGADRAGTLTLIRLFLVVFCASLALFWASYEPPRVNVRWADTVTPSTREALEARFGLIAPSHEAGPTWSYDLTNLSTDNIRQLVQDAAVVDTHNIDRERFSLAADDVSEPAFGAHSLLWSTAFGLAAVLLAGWIGRNRLSRAGSTIKRAASMRAVVSAATRGVPELSAEALGFFRFFYAAFLALALFNEPLTLEAGRIPDDGQLGWRWLGWLASRPDLVALLEVTILGLLVIFAIGLWARVAYGLMAAGMTVWILVWIESQHSNAHMWIVTLFMVVCLIPVPWGAALSVDERLRTRRGGGAGPALRGKKYGYAVWMPGLILGTVWASAAYAKLESSGLEWMLGGAVKYHWVIDAKNAPVEWGLWIASHHWAAVIMSFCGVLLEAVFILSVFIKPGRWRIACASTGFALLMGFYLFHGVLWWTWWLAYLSFIIPWASLYAALDSRFHLRTPARPSSSTRPGDLQPVHFVLMVLVCVHAMATLPAGFGRFESYSNTYASIDEFEALRSGDSIHRLWVAYGTATPVEVDGDLAAGIIPILAGDAPLTPQHAGTLRRLDGLTDLFGDGPRRLTLTREPRKFDWSTGRFNPEPAAVIGTLDLDSMTLVNE